MKNRRKRAVLMGAIGLLIFSVVDSFMRYTPEQIFAGQAFIYSLYIHVVYRLPLSIIWVFVLGIWVTLRHVVRWIGIFTPLTIFLLTMSCCIFSLITPTYAILRASAVMHVQSATLDTTVYNLYYQPEESFDGDCTYILVRCEGGLVCQYVDHWYYNSCLGSKLNYALETTDTNLQVLLDGEIIATYTPER